MKLYTKTGDEGKTSLYDGSRVGKDELIFGVLGDLDELSSHIGLLIAKLSSASGIFSKNYTKDIEKLRSIQSILLDIGSNIATRDIIKKKRVRSITEENVKQMENYIDESDSKNETLTVFLLVGINELDAQCHVCRSVARRVERSMWKLEKDGECVDDNILKYMNRISDFFFSYARNLSKT